MGTMTFMSGACGLWCLRAIAAKNCDSDGYTHGSPSPRGIEEVSRAVERGVGGDEGAAGVEGVLEEGWERTVDHVERVVWSTGHASAPAAGAGWSTGHLSVMSVLSRKMGNPGRDHSVPHGPNGTG